MNRHVWHAALLCVSAAIVSPAAAAEEPAAPAWPRHVVAEGFANQTAVAADFTGDGLCEVITNDAGVTRMYVAPDWREVVIDAANPPRRAIHSAIMDCDGDGDLDYVAANYSNPGLIFWLEPPADATHSAWTYHMLDDQLDGIHGLIVGDIDGDGRDDLAATSAQPKGAFPNSLAWYGAPVGEAAKKPWTRRIFADGDAPGLSHYLGLGDVNGDGRVDAASGAKGGEMDPSGMGEWFAWWEAPADRTAAWTKHMLSDHEPGATNVLMADVNKDGHLDMVASRGHGVGLLWFEGPDFKPHTIDDRLVGPHCLATADFDADGDIDITTCAKDSRIACWFENDGKGAFTMRTLSDDQAAYDIRAVDMEGDGDLDILIAGQASNNVVWFENPTKVK